MWQDDVNGGLKIAGRLEDRGVSFFCECQSETSLHPNIEDVI